MRRAPGGTLKGRRLLVIAILAAASSAVWTRGLAAEEPAVSPPLKLGKELFRFGKEGIGPAQMTQVEAVAVDAQGFIYGGDNDLQRVQRFNPAGKLESLLYFDGRVEALACDRDGTLYVIAGRRLFRYDPKTWALRGEIERPSGKSFQAVTPRPEGGVAALRDGDILLIDKDGKIARIFHDTVHAAITGLMIDPHIAVDRQGNLYVSEEMRGSVYRFSPEGRFINRFEVGEDPTSHSHQDIPALAVDGHDHVWVAGWQGVRLFSPDGRFLQSLDVPDVYGFAVDGRGEIYAGSRTAIIKYATGKR